ncbi:hypothetical protein [Bacteriovorax sp. Seq25_V]|uniref:hypothetical protein n=1 Tax=Bacteriovorax sp. Seq25_V TaxID=1201288 RepID=UPI00038A0710|nr:hypothetical protein [Bacteriovorax sp. Seq25_V]EQC43396.1 putative lipoprotein [Bacteriovorax sp. Seq25_V]
MKKYSLILFSILIFSSCNNEESRQNKSISNIAPTATKQINYKCDGNDCLESVLLIKSGNHFCEGVVLQKNSAVVPSECISSCKITSGYDIKNNHGLCTDVSDFYTSENGQNLKLVTFDSELGTAVDSMELHKNLTFVNNATITNSGTEYIQENILCELTFKSIFRLKAASESFEELNLKDCGKSGIINSNSKFLGLISAQEGRLSIGVNQSCLTGYGVCNKSDSIKSTELLSINKINKNLKDISLKKAQILNSMMMKPSDYEEVTLLMPDIDITEDAISISDRVDCFSKKPNFWINNKLMLPITLNAFGEIATAGEVETSKDLFLFEAIENHYNPFNGEAVETVIVPTNVQENILNQTPTFKNISQNTSIKIKANLITNTPNIFVRNGKFESIVGHKDLGKYNNLSLRTFDTCAL